jgi:nucleotide-binding universal stress UspA family protein
MHPVRSILVHIDGSPRSAVRLALARRWSDRLGCELEAVLAVAPSLADMPVAYGAGAEAASMMLQLDADRRHRARETFRQEAERSGLPMRWTELDQEVTQHAVVRRALYADLLVLGQYDPHDTLAWGVGVDFVPTLIESSGRPALVLPYVGDWAAAADTLGREVLIAWKPSREAARAVSAALPWLRQARNVHLMSAGADGEPPEAFDELKAHLGRHGVTAGLHAHRAPGRDVGENLLSLAADVGADLLVMGCYGHSRTREWLLGGVTRTVLQSMTLPVLMSH